MGARKRKGEERLGTVALSNIVDAERDRIIAGATDAQRARLGAAEQARAVYRAWNTVCGGTREGDHVTGLKYLPDTNELLVYTDGASWTQEMTMLREIIRARMERAGVRLDGFVFRTSPEGYRAREAAKRVVWEDVQRAERPPAPRAPLSDAEERAVDEEVAPIGDAKLRRALKLAISASMEWKKGSDAQNRA